MTVTTSLQYNRRALLGAAGALGAFLLDPPPGVAEREPDVMPSNAIDDAYPSQDPAVVREVVGVSHGNLARVRELVEARPELANAAWDWGFGDWETALGAASHVGRRDIAGLLLEHGARPDLFTFAMLGNAAAVRAAIEAAPGIQRRRGPHGITLLAHARAGGEQAAEVVRYLEALGDADPVYSTAPLSDEEARAVTGTFTFAAGDHDRFVVEPSDFGGLALRRGAGIPRPLFHLGGLQFHPSGAPSARIRIAPGAAGAPARLEIRNPDLVLVATKIASP